MADTPDEIRFERYREANPHLFEEPKTELCDCCLTQQEDVRLSPDDCGFVCVECIGKTFESSYAIKKLLDISNHTREELSDWFYKLKL